MTLLQDRQLSGAVREGRGRFGRRAARAALAFAALATPGVGLVAVLPTPVAAQSLRGSKPSVEKMYWFAQSNRLQFHSTEESVRAAASVGRLVPLSGGPGYELASGVGWPYVTAETRTFVETFAPQYEAACGAPLVVTSATRPSRRQPRNANPHSVHPAGIAVDLRRPPAGPCLDWLRAALVELERRGFVEATEERHPVHFHVAVLTPPGRARRAPTLQLAAGRGRRGRPARVEVVVGGEVELARRTVAFRSALMEAPVDRRIRVEPAPGHLPFRRLLPVATQLHEVAGTVALPPVVVEAAAWKATARTASSDTSERETHDAAPVASGPTYRVRPGDTLWDLSRKLHVPVRALLQANGLRERSVLRPGTVLKLPSESDHAGRR